MGGKKKRAFVYVCLRRCVPAGHSQDSGVSTRDTTRRRRNDVGRGRKGRKTKRRKGREGKNESYRAALDIEFVLSIVLPSIQRYYVPAYAISSAIDTSVSIYERLPEVTADEFLFETLERERERETVSPRESSFIVRDSVPREREKKYKVRFIRNFSFLSLQMRTHKG